MLILEGSSVQPFTKIGNNVSIWSNSHIGHHSVISDHVTITSKVVISGNCKIGENCFLGVNSSTKDGITLGEFTFVGMGANITADTNPESVHLGTSSDERKISSKRLKY